jgi:transcriptional regulator with XRE-family HTH domain
MRISGQNTDDAVMKELGERLARTRLERNISQQELATEAGVSKSTVERAERGAGANLSNLIRILRVLGLLDRLNTLVPEPLPSPIERLKLEGRRRRRAAPAARADDTASTTWRWGDGDTP